MEHDTPARTTLDMTPEEIALALHRHFNGDTRWVTERYQDGGRWRNQSVERAYTREDRLKDSTHQSFIDTDGYRSMSALTYQDIMDALGGIARG